MIGDNMGKVIPFPLETEKIKLLKELQLQESEIKMCLDELEALNEMIVEMTAEYEMLLNRLCELNGVKIPNDN